MKKLNWYGFLTLTIVVFFLLIINNSFFENHILNTYQNLKLNPSLDLIKITPVYAQENEINSTTENNELNNKDSEVKKVDEPAMVRIDGKDLFPISIQIGDISPSARAKDIEEKIIKVAENKKILPEDLEIVDLEGLKLIQSGDILIVAFSKSDAESVNQPLSELAKERLEKIKNAIIEYRKSRTDQSIFSGTLIAIISTIFAVISWFILNKTLPYFFEKFKDWQQQKFRSIRFQGLQFLSSNQVTKIFTLIFKIIRFFLIIIVLYIYIPLVLSCFPVTKPYGVRLLRSFWKAINLVLGSIADYIPNIFIIGLISFLAYYSLRFARIFFNAIKRDRIRLRGFYPEWAEPTYKIATFLIIGLALVLIFPYLPASDSPGFQGVSLFMGALVTFGSTTVIGNIVSGIVLIYTRSFQLGDMINANGHTGKVIEKNMLSTRILTPDNEVITIPNGSLIGSDITNYSSVIRDQKQPLILKTTITLGYDVPWRKIHQVLVEAAKDSDGILSQPEPFVFQTSLDDYYVAYTLKAFTDKPEKMNYIYSQLHQNIQDKCNSADIEILSPHYRAVRDGNQTTIPADYLPDDYQIPSFHIKSE